MTIDDFCRHLLKIYSATENERRLEMLAREIAAFFEVRAHEVAFFQLDAAGRNATFRWPPPRSGSMAQIPLKSFVTSLVRKTVTEKGVQIDNAFAAANHLRMLEHTLDTPEHRIPVQKIVSAPVLRNATPTWVIQISRKGKTPAEAGPDFDAADAARLEEIAGAIAQLDL